MAFVTRELGIITTNDINEEVDAVFHWDFKNESVVSDEVLKLNKPIFNAGCLNVKKDYVDKCFTKVFGYSSFIDPLTHKGQCVKKSTQQAVHGGKIIDCPIDKIDDRPIVSKGGIVHKRIYQKLIDNTVSEEEIKEIGYEFKNDNKVLLKEYRVTYCFGKIGVFVRYKEPVNRFHPYYMKRSMLVYKKGKVFTDKEYEKIIEFSKIFSFDFADMDILIDSDGKMYIIDVNNIATGSIMDKHPDRKGFIKEIAKIFKNGVTKKA